MSIRPAGLLSARSLTLLTPLSCVLHAVCCACAGEDSIDVCKSSYLDRFSFLTTNYKALVHKLNPASGLNKLDIHTADAYLNGELTPAPAQPAGKKGKSKSAVPAAPAVLDPVLSLFNPGRFLGSLSEKYAEGMGEYIAKDPDGMFKAGAGMTPEKFKALMKLHYIACLVNPGESVGILAGQSIGEPSTQMTLVSANSGTAREAVSTCAVFIAHCFSLSHSRFPLVARTRSIWPVTEVPT